MVGTKCYISCGLLISMNFRSYHNTITFYSVEERRKKYFTCLGVRVFRWTLALLRTFADFTGPGTNKDHELVVTEYEILRFVSTASIANGGRYFISKLQAISDIKI